MFDVLIKVLKKIFPRGEDYVHYLSGAEALPRPYTPDEEQELLSRLGDDGESVRSALIEHNLRLVVYIARKFDNTPPRADAADFHLNEYVRQRLF